MDKKIRIRKQSAKMQSSSQTRKVSDSLQAVLFAAGLLPNTVLRYFLEIPRIFLRKKRTSKAWENLAVLCKRILSYHGFFLTRIWAS